MKHLYLLVTAACAAAAATPANAATTFRFDPAGSYVDVASQTGLCLGCSVSASLASLPAFTLNKAGDSFSFDFANFVVKPGIGVGKALIEAQLAILDPFSATVGTSSATAKYLRLGGWLTSGVTAGALTWSNPTQVMSADDGTKFAVTFGDVGGIGLGGSASSRVTVSLLSSAVPEPATWAMMILGFGMVGAALRRRTRVNAVVRFA